MESMPKTPEQKRSFLLGGVTGVVVIALLGGVFFLGANFGGGGLKLAGTGQNNNPSGGNNQPAQNNPSQPQQADGTKIAPVSKDDHIRGNQNAKVTMIEYSDFQCPYCQKFHETLTQIMADYNGKVRLVYRQFPLRQIHPNAQKAAEASECANDQGKFWEMHDKLFELNKAQTLSLDTMKSAAKQLGLNTGTFNDCLDNSKAVPKVEQDYQDGVAAGVNGTPATFVNGQVIEGAVPIESLKSLIEASLK